MPQTLLIFMPIQGFCKLSLLKVTKADGQRCYQFFHSGMPAGGWGVVNVFIILKHIETYWLTILETVIERSFRLH